jgi:hypothetical protein
VGRGIREQDGCGESFLSFSTSERRLTTFLRPAVAQGLPRRSRRHEVQFSDPPQRRQIVQHLRPPSAACDGSPCRRLTKGRLREGVQVHRDQRRARAEGAPRHHQPLAAFERSSHGFPACGQRHEDGATRRPYHYDGPLRRRLVCEVFS